MNALLIGAGIGLGSVAVSYAIAIIIARAIHIADRSEREAQAHDDTCDTDPRVVALFASHNGYESSHNGTVTK